MGSYNTTGILQKSPAVSAGKAEDANAAVKVDTPEITKLDALQMLLDVVGLIPGFGAPADLLNSLVSAMRGDWLGAGLSLVGVIPIAGEAATAAKIAKNSERYLAGVRKVATEVVPHLPKSMQKPIKEAIEAAEKKIDELAGKTHKAPDTEVPKPSGEKKPGSKSKPKKKMKCGEYGKYGELKKKTGDGKYDRDHIPSKAALKAKAKELNGGEELSSKQKTAIDNWGNAIAIPRKAHEDHSPTHSQSLADAAVDSENLAGSARRDVEAMLKHIDEYDEDGGCKKAYQKASKRVLRMSNEDYAKALQDILNKVK